MDREQLLQRKALIERKLEIMRQLQSTNENTEIPQKEELEPSGFSKLMTNLSRPGATNRAMIRQLGSGSLDKIGQAGSEAWANPENVETLQNQLIRKTNEALPKNTPEFLRNMAGFQPSAVGFVADQIVDPVAMGIGAATEGLLPLIAKIPYKGATLGDRATFLPWTKTLATEEGQAAKATKLAVQARDKAVKLYPQQKGSLEDIRNTGEQTAKYIGKSKNYEDVANQMEMAKGINAGERQRMYDSGTIANTGDEHGPIRQLLTELENAPNASSVEGKRNIKFVSDVLNADIESNLSTPVKQLNDPNFYQQKKAFYQSEADKAGAYRTDPSQAIKSRANRALSQGYQNKTYSVNEAIKPINQEEAGLMKSYDMAREMATGEAVDLKPSIAKEAAGSISGSPIQTGASFVRKGILDRILGSEAKRLTDPMFGRGIPKLMAESERARALSEAIASMKAPEQVSIEFQKQLPPPEPKQIGFDRRAAIGRSLIDASSGKTINVPESGRSPIAIPEVLESEKQALMNKWGVPERNIRETISLSDIEPVIKSSSIDTSLNPDKRTRNFIQQLMDRRKRNFGA